MRARWPIAAAVAVGLTAAGTLFVTHSDQPMLVVHCFTDAKLMPVSCTPDPLTLGPGSYHTDAILSGCPAIDVYFYSIDGHLVGEFEDRVFNVAVASGGSHQRMDVFLGRQTTFEPGVGSSSLIPLPPCLIDIRFFAR